MKCDNCPYSYNLSYEYKDLCCLFYLCREDDGGCNIKFMELQKLNKLFERHNYNLSEKEAKEYREKLIGKYWGIKYEK